MITLKQEVFEYLDWLRESGETNMFGAVPFIMEEYDFIEYDEARDYLLEWMKTFAQRHSKEEN